MASAAEMIAVFQENEQTLAQQAELIDDSAANFESLEPAARQTLIEASEAMQSYARRLAIVVAALNRLAKQVHRAKDGEKR